MRRRAIVLTVGFLIVVISTTFAPSAFSWFAPLFNQAPHVTNLSPPDEATGVHPNQTLSWLGTDDDGDPLTYAIAFGKRTYPYPWPIVAITTLTRYTPTLELGTTYVWAVAASDGISTTAGPIWSFTTNRPPYLVRIPYPPYYSPIPPDGAMGVPTSQILSWSAVDPDEDPLTYTLALDTNDPPPIIATTTLTNYAPTLSGSATYYWVITVTDGISLVGGPTWHFTTASCYLPLVLRNF